MTRSAHGGPASARPEPLVEIVRLPVATDRFDALVAFLDGHAYFSQPGLVSWRVLAGGDGSEVALVIDWLSPEAPKQALTSPIGRTLVEGLDTLLSGPPVTAYYWEVP